MDRETTNSKALTWSRIEVLLDEAMDGSNILSAINIKHIVDRVPKGNTHSQEESKWLAQESRFEQGAYKLTPDMFDLAAGVEPKLHRGTLMSRYKVIKALQSGGMADVYLVERADGQYEKQVALKMLSAGLNNPALRIRFKREMQILAELRHPGIVPLLDAGIAEDGRPWLVLEYIPGIPLTKYCSQHHLSQPAIIELFIKVCNAVSYAHKHGIIHRDLKPENILVEGDTTHPQPVILDFGIAARKQDTELTQVGNLLGTPAYSSPEQAMGNSLDIDQRSDIFSLGVLLYELIDKRRPFRGNNNTEISYRILNQDAPALSQPGISADLSALIFKCLEKSPNNRYTSVQQLINDLKNFKQGKPVSANPVGIWFRTRRKLLRYPLISTLVLLASAIIIVLASTAIWQYSSRNNFAALQARTAEHFGQAAQQIESSVRLIYSRPLHNTEKELNALNQTYLV